MTIVFYRKTTRHVLSMGHLFSWFIVVLITPRSMNPNHLEPFHQPVNSSLKGSSRFVTAHLVYHCMNYSPMHTAFALWQFDIAIEHCHS